MDRLKDKVAVVTGASSGIGAETARLFASEGARVVLVARRQQALDAVAAEITAAGGECMTAAADVTVQADCEGVFRAVEARYGRVDILVNNAGDGDQHMTVAKCTDEMWYRMIELNQTSVLRFCREALRYMERQGSGAIVNLSAIAGVYGNAGVSYSAAKAAVIAMTKNIAVQYAGHGIRCNAVCPGPTWTALNTPDKVATFDKEFSALCDRLMNYELGFPSTEDQANAIMFFASDEAKSITGQTLTVDNGIAL